jgi:endonuclease YncB( thermonuclease family)
MKSHAAEVAIATVLAIAIVISLQAQQPGSDHKPVEAVKVEAPPLGMTLPGKVINIVDGDTLDVETSLVVRVRLRDCWAPESRTLDHEEKKRGLASKANLKLIAEGKYCRVNVPISRFLTNSLTLDRVLGSVWLDGEPQDVSTLQVQGGFATRTKVPKQ